jgi:hypothetical protein
LAPGIWPGRAVRLRLTSFRRPISPIWGMSAQSNSVTLTERGMTS